MSQRGKDSTKTDLVFHKSSQNKSSESPIQNEPETVDDSHSNIMEFIDLLAEFHVQCDVDAASERFTLDTVDVCSLQEISQNTDKILQKTSQNGQGIYFKGFNEIESDRTTDATDECITYSRHIEVKPSFITFLRDNGICCDIDDENRTCTVHTIIPNNIHEHADDVAYDSSLILRHDKHPIHPACLDVNKEHCIDDDDENSVKHLKKSLDIIAGGELNIGLDEAVGHQPYCGNRCKFCKCTIYEGPAELPQYAYSIV